MIEFKIAAPETTIKESIVADGKVMGEITFEPRVDKHHVTVRLPVGGYNGIGLIQGFSDSKMGAILNAIEMARQDATKLLHELAVFEKMVQTQG